MVKPLSVLPRARRRRHPERGAAAVEMALVLPLLLFILMGLIDFGRAYNALIQLSQASREGVRLASLNPGPSANASSNPDFGDSAITGRVSTIAGSLPTFAASCSAPTASLSSACIIYCPNGDGVATVVVKSSFTWITGISGMSKFFSGGASGGFPTPTTIQTTGVMRCAG